MSQDKAIGAVGDTVKWAGKNPIVPLMLGQTLTGSMDARAAAEQQQEEWEREDREAVWGASDSGDRSTFPTQSDYDGQMIRTDPTTGRQTVVRQSDLVDAQRKGLIGGARAKVNRGRS